MKNNKQFMQDLQKIVQEMKTMNQGRAQILDKWSEKKTSLDKIVEKIKK